MKIVQSFWSKPYYSREYFFNNAGGWSHRTFNYMSWALSCLRFKKFYGRVELVTDELGKKLLVDIMELPYDNVSLKLNELNAKYSRFENIWALGKIYAYSIQEEPFIHADGDVYIWGQLPERIEKSALLAQEMEYDFDLFHKNNLQDIFNKIKYVPAAIKNYYNKTGDTSQYNAGIIGGNDVDFFKEYTREAIKIVDNNLNTIKGQFISTTSFPCFFEQYLYLCMAHEKKHSVETLFPVNKTMRFHGLADFHNAHASKYIHLMGSNKLDFSNGEFVAQFLWREFPEYYHKIIELVAKKEI